VSDCHLLGAGARGPECPSIIVVNIVLQKEWCPMSVREAHELFYAALNANIAGETGPMHAVWSQTHEVTNLGPFGDMLVGRAAVLAQFDAEARMDMSGQIVPEEVHVGQAGEMGYSTCIERGVDFIAGGAPVEVNHRVTNVFVREADGWKIVHHHTDRTVGLDVAQ
jgi:ketosteroid isomerase-like protein